jgi:hypothetical protein
VTALAAQIVAHHLELVGVRSQVVSDGDDRPGRIRVACGHSSEKVTWIVFASDTDELDRLGIPVKAASGRPGTLTVLGGGHAWMRLKTHHPIHYVEAYTPLVVSANGDAVWACRQLEDGNCVLILGSDLAADLTLLRQGAPSAALNRPLEAMWGFAGERPNYLFAEQFDPGAPFDRQADWWIWTLREALASYCGVAAQAPLPGGAPGMVVVTGDDDQAAIEAYRAQSKLLGTLPVTYFLHPLTKHDRESMAEISAGRIVEWEIHPDALEQPGEYAALLKEQARWFESLVGRPARLVRNHGYLNDGYWGHAKPWLEEGILASSNLPGVEGNVINGSLLPARLVLDGKLSDHWSVLTAFGDGAMFIRDWDDATAFNSVVSYGRRVVESDVPGVLVLNLHPENHARAAPMHAAARELVRCGFLAVTLGEAIAWFAEGKEPVRVTREAEPAADAGDAPLAVAAAPSVEAGERATSVFARASAWLRRLS